MTCLSNLTTTRNKDGKKKIAQFCSVDQKIPDFVLNYSFLLFPTLLFNYLDIQARYPQIRPLMETLSTAKNPVTSNLAKVYLLENP